MSPDSQFWLNLLVQIVVAVGTLGAVIVALFGNWLQSKLIPPLLRISLANPDGNLETISGPPPFQPLQSRWYHIRIENKQRASKATEVQLYLLRIEEPNARGTYAPSWTGEVPMLWRHGNFNPTLTRTIGPPAENDLVYVSAQRELVFQLVITPNSLASLVKRTTPCNMRLSLQARGVEGDSNILVLEMVWNGVWEAETDKMRRHLVLTTVSA